jgi:cytochrome c553
MKTRLLITAAITLATAASLARSTELTPDVRDTAARMAVGTCANCHGARGTSVVPKFPNLAAQPAPYIASQLKAFRARSRTDPDALAFMWGMAAPLNDALIEALAEYYSAKPAPASSGGDRTLRARGKAIYENGLAALEVPSCGSCHGARGKGMEQFPRLAGQHPQYFLNQMRSFQNNLRDSDPMRLFAKKLNAADLEALAAYIQTL